MVSIQPPGPLHCAGAKDERSAGCSIKREAVSRRSGLVIVTKIRQKLWYGLRGTRKIKQSGGPEAIVLINIPLVTEHRRAQSRCLTARQRCYTGVSPEP